MVEEKFNKDKSNNFSIEEAQRLVSHKVTSLIEFSGVPKGTTGIVLEPYEGDYTPGNSEVRSLPIRWELPERKAKPLVDWFSKDGFIKFLKCS